MYSVGPRFDVRESPTHRRFLETPGTLAYLPTAGLWALRPEVVGVALLCGVPVGLFSGSLPALWLALLFGSGAIIWLAAVVARAVWGFGDPPMLRSEDIATVGPGAMRVAAVAILVVAGYAALDGAPPFWREAFAWVSGILAPSMFALLSVEGALAPALDPRRSLRVLFASGIVGWALAVFCGWGMVHALEWVFMRLQTIDTAVALINTPPSGAGAVFAVAVIWIAAIVAHLFGHALHHRHTAAGLGVMLDVPDELETERRVREAAVARAAEVLERAAKAHDLYSAQRLVAAGPPDGVTALAYFNDLWDAMHARKQFAAAVFVARPLLEAAVAAKRFQFAAEVWATTKRHSPSFELAPEVAERFAVMARANRAEALAEQLEARS